MKIFKIILMLIVFLNAIIICQDNENIVNNDNVNPFIFSFWDNTNDNLNPFSDRTTNFHLTLISGRVGSVQGLQLGGFVNNVKNNFIGYDGTGIASTVGGNFAGIQHTGIYNRVDGSFVGIQDVGIYSYVGSDFFGIQSTGIANQVYGHFTGIQTVGIYNYANSIKGLQIAGIVNEAGYVKGAQIGLVNISDKLDGIAIGLVNISKSGSVHGLIWGGGTMNTNVGVKFAPNHYWFTAIGIGHGSKLIEEDTNFSVGGFMGFRIPIYSKIYAEFDLGNYSIVSESKDDDWKWEEDAYFAVEARASILFEIHKRITLQAGFANINIFNDYNYSDNWKKDNKPFIGIQF